MDKKILKQVCKYYRGETKCPFVNSIPKGLWFAERTWADMFDEATENNDSGKVLMQYFDEYQRQGLLMFSTDDGVPVSLKTVLFNRYCQTAETTDVEGFKKWYKDTYLGNK